MAKVLSPKQLETLARNKFKKGESGNPNGRKKGSRNYQTIYREALELVAEAADLPADVVETMLTGAQILRALKGDTKAYDTLHDRVHGKPVQTNLNKDINDAELDESEVKTMDAMLAKFIKKPAKPAKKKATKKAAKKATKKK